MHFIVYYASPTKGMGVVLSVNTYLFSSEVDAKQRTFLTIADGEEFEIRRFKTKKAAYAAVNDSERLFPRGKFVGRGLRRPDGTELYSNIQ